MIWANIARGKLSKLNREMAGKMISLDKGLEEVVANVRNVAKATMNADKSVRCLTSPKY